MLNQTSTEWKQSRDEARQTIIEHSREYFTSDKSGKGYICPVCGSGSGEHGTGVTENPKKPNHFTCWRGCFKNADIFEVIGKEYGLGSFAEQYTKACEIFGISPDDGVVRNGFVSHRINPLLDRIRTSYACQKSVFCQLR